MVSVIEVLIINISLSVTTMEIPSAILNGLFNADINGMVLKVEKTNEVLGNHVISVHAIQKTKAEKDVGKIISKSFICKLRGLKLEVFTDIDS